MEIYGSSFGNYLSCYWHCRAYCIYKNIDFNFSKFIKLDNNKLLPQSNCIKQNWANFLEDNIKKVTYNKEYNFNDKILVNNYIKDQYKNNSLETDFKHFTEGNKEFLLWSHLIVGSWTNIIDIINNDTDKAIDRYLKFKDENLPKYEENEVVIHFRTGNVLIGYANPDYPMLKFKYFYDIIKKEKETKNISKITIIWKMPYNNKETKVENGDYERDLHTISALKKYLEEKHDNINVNIENKYFSDFIYMFYAPILVISPSSFGFWAGVASKNICYSPICTLLCNLQTPKIRDNFYWRTIDNYFVDCHCAYRTNKNNDLFINELLN